MTYVYNAIYKQPYTEYTTKLNLTSPNTYFFEVEASTTAMTPTWRFGDLGGTHGVTHAWCEMLASFQLQCLLMATEIQLCHILMREYEGCAWLVMQRVSKASLLFAFWSTADTDTLSRGKHMQLLHAICWFVCSTFVVLLLYGQSNQTSTYNSTFPYTYPMTCPVTLSVAPYSCTSRTPQPHPLTRAYIPTSLQSMTLEVS